MSQQVSFEFPGVSDTHDPSVDLNTGTGSQPREDASARPALTRSVTVGTMTYLRGRGYVSLTEVPLNNNRRADIVGLKADGTVMIVEVKSGVEDFRSDAKWLEYLDFADYFFLALPVLKREEAERVHAAALRLSPKVGLILADRFGGDTIRAAGRLLLKSNRRAALMRRLAHLGAQRLTERAISGAWQTG